MLREKDIIVINGKMRAVSVFVIHQARIMERSIGEMHTEMKTLPEYLEFRADYMALNPRLPPDWHVGKKRLEKERCFCCDKHEDRGCGCVTHVQMSYLLKGLRLWRHAEHLRCKCTCP